MSYFFIICMVQFLCMNHILIVRCCVGLIGILNVWTDRFIDSTPHGVINRPIHGEMICPWCMACP